jgi:hypothetical protein
VFSSCLYLCSIVFICACVFLLFVHLFNCLYLYICFPLVCTFVQLFLSVRVYSSWGKQIYRYKQLNKCTNKRNTHAHIKTIEQRYKQEEYTRTYKNNWTKIQTIGKLNYFYLCVCIPLVCIFVQLFLYVRVFSSCLYLCSIVFICACVFLWFVHLFNCLYLYICFPLKTHAQIKTIE